MVNMPFCHYYLDHDQIMLLASHGKIITHQNKSYINISCNKTKLVTFFLMIMEQKIEMYT